MLRLLVAAALAWPAAAEFLSIELRIEGIGCASCIESIPARIQRMRGVDSVKTDAAKGVVTISLAAGNRVRLEQVRDAIEQDGTKVKSASVRVSGTVSKEDGRRVLTVGSTGYWLEGKEVTEAIEGEIADLHPAAGRMTLAVR